MRFEVPTHRMKPRRDEWRTGPLGCECGWVVCLGRPEGLGLTFSSDEEAFDLSDMFLIVNVFCRPSRLAKTLRAKAVFVLALSGTGFRCHMHLREGSVTAVTDVDEPGGEYGEVSPALPLY